VGKESITAMSGDLFRGSAVLEGWGELILGRHGPRANRKGTHE